MGLITVKFVFWGGCTSFLYIWATLWTISSSLSLSYWEKNWISSVAVFPLCLIFGIVMPADKKCYSTIDDCCFTEITRRHLVRECFFFFKLVTSSTFVLENISTDGQLSSFSASLPLSPLLMCTLAFGSVASTITDYSTESVVAPRPSQGVSHLPRLTQ